MSREFISSSGQLLAPCMLYVLGFFCAPLCVRVAREYALNFIWIVLHEKWNKIKKKSEKWSSK